MSTQQLIEQARADLGRASQEASHFYETKLVVSHINSALLFLDELAAELERLERKPLTQSAVELAFKESLATHYYDFVDGVRFAERAHHIGEGEEK